ncbi:nucleotide exchange factor GrpE [Lactiplantibacillus fabifermentans]|uniref:Protein GrpE n=1 Tax=Lactiplantibacillus fabifermentans DSM 21115 TaxID=1413187 RepID=A0A0R2NIS5_9LACO|nr:nucleotide exchange factor GrpE [Lactiplantibacillus fabifermentans]KRO25694.1 co-chaperone GrpE [Lactiplantibacillus fabifermentans DSM 21115]
MKSLAKEPTSSAATDEEKVSAASQAATSTADDAAKTTADDQQATTDVDPRDAQIADLQKQLDAKDDQLLRTQAELVNMQNRFKKEQAAIIKYDGQTLAKDVLPVLDNLERALAAEASDEAASQLKKGVEMVYGHLQEALKKNNVTEVKAAGEKFDPNVAQAVQTVPADDDHPADTVVQVLQKGYLFKDRTLRPAMVIVAQ